ncbi:MAG: serine/threonine-protein kinase [Acidobacteriota bacterium]|nr:serine/threonine-protein kinase [Acidobacteriota bacterium]
MTAERWLEIEELFNQSIELDLPERQRFLSKIYDADLRREVEALIDAERANQGKLAGAVQSAAEHFINNSDDPIPASRQIGNYQIIREIGRGGMGAVYLAVRDDEIKKSVALKIIKRGMDTDEILRRFRTERQILAALDHPNIARLLDGGTTGDGLHFFVMEYVEGLPLLDYCERHQLSTAERLALFRQICAAVSYAHQNLIVHRDLKPSNILITKDGIPKLLDFGIAKMLNPEFSSQTANQTATAFRLMTPEYASPEQVRGEQITTASDVYSLGVLLYELLTGHRPYQIKARCTHAEIVRAVCDTIPERPSSVAGRFLQKTESFTKKNKQRTANKEQRTKSLKGDLDNIVLTALRKEPVRRYRSVEQLSEDIGCHLNGLPISARPATFVYRAGKFVRRNRAIVALSSFVLTLLIGFAVTESFQSNRFRRERDRANIERERAEKVSAFLTEIFRSANPAQTKGKELTAREFLDKGAARIQGELRDQPEVQVKLLMTIVDAYVVLGHYDRAEPLAHRAFDISREAFGDEHQQTLESKERLAGVKIWRSGKEEAVRLRLELDAAYRRIYGDDLKTAFNLRELSRAFGVAGKKPEADQALIESVELARRILPGNSSQLSAFLTAEAEIYWDKYDFARTEPLLREALKIGQTIESENPLDAAGNYGNLGRMLMNKGALDEAEPLLRRAWELRRSNIKEDSFMVGISLFNVGDCLFQKGNFDEAEQILRRVIEIYQKDGNGSVHLADALLLSGRIAEAKNALPEAEEFYRRAIAEAPRSWGAHAHKYNFPVYLGLLMIKKGEARQAEPLLRESLRGLQEIYDDDHISVSYAQSTLGECLTVLGKREEAESLLRQSVENLQRKLGAHHQQSKEALNRLHRIYHMQGKTAAISE